MSCLSRVCYNEISLSGIAWGSTSLKLVDYYESLVSCQQHATWLRLRTSAGDGRLAQGVVVLYGGSQAGIVKTTAASGRGFCSLRAGDTGRLNCKLGISVGRKCAAQLALEKIVSFVRRGHYPEAGVSIGEGGVRGMIVLLRSAGREVLWPHVATA